MTKKGEGARGNLYNELQPPAPDAPGEAMYQNLLNLLDGGAATAEELPDELGPAIVQRLLISLREREKESTMHRLVEVMAAHGYYLDETDPDNVTLRKKKTI